MKTLLEAGARTEVLARLDTLRPDTPGRWGKMNVGRMLCHLSDSMRMASGELPTKPKGKKIFATFPLKHLMMYVLPWPKGAPTAPELLLTPPAEFEADRTRFQELVKRFGESVGPAPPVHPLFGPLTAQEWGFLQYRHVDHHFKQFGI